MRITNPYVIQTELIEETGVQEVDDALYCIVNVLNLSIGESLRAILLIGSFVDGSYALDSDIDCCFIWKAGIDQAVYRKGVSLIAHLSRMFIHEIDPMYNASEAPFYDVSKFTDDSFGYPCGPILKLAIKEHSLLLWGENIRPRVALSGQHEIQQDVIAPAMNWIKQKHYGSLDAEISYPLREPFPEKADRGYGKLHEVAILVLHIARALIYLRTQQFLFDKRKLFDAFEMHVGGPWARLVREVCKARYEDLSQQAKEQIHYFACQNMVAFENYFLEESGFAQKQSS